MSWDVAIIGGGPAGAAAAISLLQLVPDARVAIFDAAPRNPWKPGETLAPAARPLLESLGCWHDLQQAVRNGSALENFATDSVWGSESVERKDFLFGIHGNGWRLDRPRFDAMLLGKAQSAGVSIHKGATLRGADWLQNSWKLSFAGHSEESKFVIDASGRSARLAIDRGIHPQAKDSLIGLFVLFPCAAGGNHEPLIEACESGWWYSTSIPDETIVAAFMSDADLIRSMQLKQSARWHALLALSHETRKRVESGTARSAPMIFAAQSQKLPIVAGPGWAAAGDAAMAFDPLSSHGITKALRSGKIASFAAADWLRGHDTHARYCSIADAEWQQYEAARIAYYRQETRWPHAPFWARRQSTLTS